VVGEGVAHAAAGVLVWAGGAYLAAPAAVCVVVMGALAVVLVVVVLAAGRAGPVTVTAVLAVTSYPPG
jgi:hypothetical protein